MPAPIQPIVQYLTRHFSAEDLRMFLALNYPDLVPGLPGVNVGAAHFIFAAVERLGQYGYLQAPFFTLLAERPGDLAALRTAAVACLGSDPFPAVGPGSVVNPAGKQVLLVLMACPEDQEHLALADEAAQIEDQLGLGAVRDRLKIVWGWSVDAEQTLDLIIDHRPTLLHFAGHGGKDGTLLLRGAGGSSFRLRYDSLARFLGAMREPPRCVLLNACYSGLAASVLTRFVDVVIGMREEIGDKAALTFSRYFYLALAQKHDVQASFGLASASLDGLDLAASHLPQLSARADFDPATLAF